MDKNLTEEQKKAVCAPVAENLVSAAAGSGKTKVLSERIVERIVSGDTGIDRLLVVTFTRAAAAQMRERISLALLQELERNPSKRLKRQLSLTAGADICTIDAFCVNILKKNFFRVDVPPDFSIADENEVKILREEVLTDVLEELYGEGDESFLLLADTLSRGRNDDALRNAIIEVYGFSSSFEEPEKWLDAALENHRMGSEGNKRLRGALLKEAFDIVKEAESSLFALSEKAAECGLDGYADVLREEGEEIKRLFTSPSAEDMASGFDNFSFGRLPGKRTAPECDDIKTEIKEERDALKKSFDRASSLCGAAISEGYSSYEKIGALCGAVKRFRRAFLEEKLKRRELEFSDCEYFAMKALKLSEEAADELRDKYDEIYIDEYQDTNPLQDAFFSLISRKCRGEANLFIVGDVKQSIYRFRHSDPGLFAEKARVFGETGVQRKMILSKNFRSRREVIDGVNLIFEKIMREGTAQIEYNEEHRLKCGASYTEYSECGNELYILSEESDSELVREQREALAAAKKIKSMVEEGFLVRGEDKRMRRACFKDFAVLTGRLHGKAEMIVKIFDLVGVPCVCSADKGFFNAMEIRTATALLKSVDNPLNDIPLASLMRSPIFGFSENELLEIRLKDREAYFYDDVLLRSEEDDSLGAKCRAFVNTLCDWRERSSVLGAAEFVETVLSESGYYSFVGALSGGAARQQNLRTLVGTAKSYEKTSYKGLYNFVRYLEKTMRSGGKIESGDEGNENAVLITTIHKAKGLEFPVVILIGCGAKFNESASYGSLVLSKEGGIGIVETIPEKRVKFKTAEYMAISQMITRESRAEQMRLLYVALTRAMEKLILIASVPKPEEFIEKCKKASAESVSDYAVRSVNSFLGYLAVSVFNAEGIWSVVQLKELPEDFEKPQIEDKEESFSANPEARRRLMYVYPYEDVKNIPSKMSVSEIKRRSCEDEEAVMLYPKREERRIPSFLQGESALTGAARGTAYHRVMELIDLNETDVEGALKRFEEKGLLTKEESSCVDCGKIRAFLSSPIGDMMRSARYVKREEPFTISANAGDVLENGGNEKICIQGTIDCFFETKDGHLVLLDYKTDFYTDAEQIRLRYKKQLELYEIAVFMKFSKKCDKKYLYLFHGDDIIEV